MTKETKRIFIYLQVIVAGGTMEPINEFKALLTNNSMNDENVNVVKCDHVVAPDNVLGICLSKGPSNVNLNFSYENRSSKDLVSLYFLS